MVKIKDAADDCMRIAKRMNQKSYKEIDHEGEDIRIITIKYDRLFIHDQRVYFIESIFVK